MTGSNDGDVARALSVLAGGDAEAREAEALARACVAAGDSSADAHVALARALVRTRKSEEAVKVCKSALARHPGHAQLEAELRSARFAVLNEIDDEEEEEEEDGATQQEQQIDGFSGAAREVNAGAQGAPQRNDPPPIHEAFSGSASSASVSASNVSDTLAFETKVERLLVHLDLQRLLRVGLWYTLLELLGLRNVTAGLACLFLGILTQAVMHHQKVMVVSMVVVGLAHSKLWDSAQVYVQRWVHTSNDKLGAVTWVPRLILALPVVLKIVGHLRFMLFLQRDIGLMLIVTATTGGFVFAAHTKDDTHPLKQWGFGKRLKFVAYGTAIGYWAVWCGNYTDTLRLVGPAFLDAGGILLSSASSADIQGVVRRAWKRLFDQVASDVQQDVDFDAWFFLGLTSWGIDYWQQPTNFSLEMITKGLADAFASFEKHAVSIFRPELHRLSQQMRHVGHNSELALLVAYLKQSLENVPPRKSLGFLGLVVKRCSSFVVAVILLVFFGTFAIPLVPFLVSETADARALYDLYGSEEMEPMDGLDVLLLGSPLCRVWQNAKAAVYCLEGGVTLSAAVATGAQIMTASVRLRQLASFAAKVKTSGLAAHADEIPDHVTNMFAVLSNYGAIADGVRHVYESSHVQDLGQSIRRWWSPAKQD